MVNTVNLNRIDRTFQRLKERHGKALITYVMAGDPYLEKTRKIILALEEGGADIIELGVPFTDPLADGPVIQKAAERGLKSKTDIAGILKMVREVRFKTEIPIILMSYYNLILQYGEEKFALQAAESGVDGIIIPDLPAGESESWPVSANDAGLKTIYLLAPTSSVRRIKIVSEVSSGFIYYVALTGITGAKLNATHEIGKKIEAIRKESPLPVASGFGISTPEEAYKISRSADGIIIGSAIVRKIEQTPPSILLPSLKRYIRSLKRALNPELHL
ncbi:MAG: tryptophan synthase subunit alpha [Nitrospiria bacterium]